MANEEITIETTAATYGTIATLNLIIDALVSHAPGLQNEIGLRLARKIAELRSDGNVPVATFLEFVQIGLERSPRALQRSEPKGSA